MIKEYIIKFTDFVCGWPLFTLLIGGGIFLFIYSRALPLRKLGMAVSSLKMKKKGEGQVSSFQALMNTISSTVGMYALTFPHCLNRQPDYLWLQIKNGVRNE